MPAALHDLRSILTHLSQAYNVRWRVSQGVTAGKREAKYNTVREPLSDAVFEQHFAGVKAVSVQPLQDDGETCRWGALDIDSYGDAELINSVRKALELFQLPCFVEHSKSLGVHVYFFFDQPVMAKPLRRALKKIAVWIGQPKAEIRPAQDRINVSEGDVGTFIVLPGYGLGVEKALEAFQAATVSLEDFNRLTAEGDFIDGPSCLFPLQRLNQRSAEWSNRNLILYQLGVFLRYKFPADWKDRLQAYNSDVIKPSLPEEEVSALVKQLEKNTRCHYICNKEPFEGVCNRASCQVRKYGVAAREAVASLISPEGITALDTDPPTWFVTLQHPNSNDTVRVKLTTGQLESVKAFKKRCLEVLKIIPELPTQKEWEALVSEMLKSIDVIPVPFEMTEHARLLDLLYKYALTSIKCTEFEGLLRGRIHIEKTEEGFRARFRLVDFITFLERYKYRGATTRDLYAMLSELSRLGKVWTETIDLAPIKIDVWTLDVSSRYMELQFELDLEEVE